MFLRGNGTLICVCALALIVFLSCSAKQPKRQPPPKPPEVVPDLEPKARKIRDDSSALAARLKLEEVERKLKAAAEELSEVAVEHHEDVVEQRKRVDEALGLFAKVRRDYIELLKRDAEQRKKIEKLEADAKAKAWLEKVVTLGGMLCLIVLAVVVAFGPVNPWLKPWLLTGIASAGAAGIIGFFLRRYGKALIWGAVGTFIIAAVGGVLYLIFSEKTRRKLLRYVGAMGRAIHEHPDAVELARATDRNSGDGLGPLLVVRGCKVDMPKKDAETLRGWEAKETHPCPHQEPSGPVKPLSRSPRAIRSWHAA